MADVAIRDVRKSYGAVAAIHGVLVDIADGEFVILVGTLGCGTSTLLRMLAGLEEITGGGCASGDGSSTTSRPRTATSPWCSRTTRSTPI